MFVLSNIMFQKWDFVNLSHFLCLQLTVDDLAALPQIQTMANQIVTITVSDDVSVSDWFFTVSVTVCLFY